MAEHRPYIAYSPELMLEICRRLAEGTALKVICREQGMPHFTNVHRWILTKEEVRTQYEAALEICGQSHADELLELADMPPEYSIDKGGKRRVDMGWVQWQRGRIDIRKWLASRLYARKYGERLDVTSGNKPIAPPVLALRYPQGTPGLAHSDVSDSRDVSQPPDSHSDPDPEAGGSVS